MDKREHALIISGICIILLLAVTNAQALQITLNMDTNPLDEGWGLINNTSDPGFSYVEDGVLTIASPSYYELTDPGNWLANVDNSPNGWMFETRMRIVASSPEDVPASFIWIHDLVNLSHFSFFPEQVGFTYPDSFFYSLDTSEFHTYRLVGLGDNIKLLIDGALALDYDRSWSGGGTETLMFGNTSFSQTVSKWDYITYRVPEGTSLLLMSTGLLGMAGIRRIKNKIN
jgi:hypothetical protein